jgi:hypothetical protein
MIYNSLLEDSLKILESAKLFSQPAIEYSGDVAISHDPLIILSPDTSPMYAMPVVRVWGNGGCSTETSSPGRLF